jgi:hypothetical protein
MSCMFAAKSARANRPYWLRGMAALAVGAAQAFLGLLPNSAASAEGESRPNIVLILADDKC